MSKPKFTPGPWFVCDGSLNVYGSTINPGRNNHRAVARINDAPPVKRDTVKANGDLISVSPKLYHAVEKAIIGYRVLKTVLEKAGLNGGCEVAVEYIAEFEALLKEAIGE